jgi:hypothetical protein
LDLSHYPIHPRRYIGFLSVTSKTFPFPFLSFSPPTDGICSGGFFDFGGAASRPARQSNADFSRRKLSLFVLSDANWPANVPFPSEETPLINFFSSPAVRSLLARSRRPLDEINFGPSKAKLFDYICEKCEPKGDSFAIDQDAKRRRGRHPDHLPKKSILIRRKLQVVRWN